MKVQKAIDNLGDNIDEVVETLLTEECYGVPSKAESCPLAVYFKDKLGRHCTVAGGRVDVHGKYFGKITTYVIPAHVREFAYQFDIGKYPELNIRGLHGV